MAEKVNPATDDEIVFLKEHAADYMTQFKRRVPGLLPLIARIEADRAIKAELLAALKKAIREHYCCDDPWYNCPKHPDGSANDNLGDDCYCGADKWNIKINALIAKAEGK